jgi:hypothetical protein
MTAKDKSIVEAIDRNTAVLERLAELIGRSTAKWLIMADMPNVRNELREDVYSEIGFSPVEIVDLLYPNLGKDARKTKRQAISKRRKKR